MPHQRCYIPNSLTENNLVNLSSEQVHYLKYVLRLKEGDLVELVNGEGALCNATIEKLSRSSGIVLCNKVSTYNRLPFSITLRQSICQMSHLEYALEKCTEAGVSHFELFQSNKSSKKPLSNQQVKRLETKIESAMVQSGSYYLPSLEIINNLNTWSCSSDTTYLFGSLLPHAQPLIHMTQIFRTNIVFIVGPESGLTQEEEESLIKFGAQPALLTPYTLRTETAGLVGVSTIMQQLYHRD